MTSVTSASDLQRLEGLFRTEHDIRLLLLAAEAKLAELQGFLSERPGTVSGDGDGGPVAWMRPYPSSGDADAAESGGQSTLTAGSPARRAVAPATSAPANPAPASHHRPVQQHTAHAPVPGPAHRCASLAERLKTYPRAPHPAHFGVGAPHCSYAFQRATPTLSARQRRHQYLYGGSAGGVGAGHLPGCRRQRHAETAFSAGPPPPNVKVKKSRSTWYSSLPNLSQAGDDAGATDDDRDPAGIVRSRSDFDLQRDDDGDAATADEEEDGGGGAERGVRRDTSFFHVSLGRDVVDTGGPVAGGESSSLPSSPPADRDGDAVPGTESTQDLCGRARRAGDPPADDVSAPGSPTTSDAPAGNLAAAAAATPADAAEQMNVSAAMIPEASHIDRSRRVCASIKRTSTIGFGLRQHTVYHCAASDRSGNVYEADRRYNDFVMLRNVIQWQYPSLKAFLPPLPEKRVLGKLHSNVVEQRRLGLQNFLQFIVSHPDLQHDEDLVLKPWLLRST